MSKDKIDIILFDDELKAIKDDGFIPPVIAQVDKKKAIAMIEKGDRQFKLNGKLATWCCHSPMLNRASIRWQDEPLYDTDASSSYEIICPHCGSTEEDTLEYNYLINGNSEEITCGTCGSVYSLSIDTTVIYETEIITRNGEPKEIML